VTCTYFNGIAANPDQSSLQNRLAWAYVTGPPPLRNPAKALTHARSAVRLAPEIGTHHNTLGVALYRLGQYREALTEFETSLASRQDAPFDRFFLAMCHVHLGDTGRARVDFERARRLQAEARLSAQNTEDLQAIRREAEALLTKSRPR
jgi:Tfp pilus assembly protein PilF